MKSVQVLRGLLLAGTIAMVTTFAAPTVLAQSSAEARDTKDKKKAPKVQAPVSTRGASASASAAIGANPRRQGEVPARCEDAHALAAQIMAGGPTDRMVYIRDRRNMDASQGHVAPPFQAQFQPRERIVRRGEEVYVHLERPQSELRNSEAAMRMPTDPQRRVNGC